MDDYDDHWEHEELVVDQRWADEEIEKMKRAKMKRARSINMKKDYRDACWCCSECCGCGG